MFASEPGGKRKCSNPTSLISLGIVVLPVRTELTTSPLPRECSNPERASLECGCPRNEAPEALSPCPAYHALGTAGRGGPRALVERTAFILATIGLGLAVGIEEPVLLRLLAEPTGT